MNKSIIKNDIVKEECTIINHSSGLTITLYPMKEYSATCAMFATKYGSIDRTFKTQNEVEFLTVPDGIAHYLEHKLFESEEQDAFNLFAETGASANAYTSFDRTAYYFIATQNFIPSLKILLNFVKSPYFTDESVQKEQGIIAQEIKMYDDNPGWRVLFNCLGGMYINHPVKADIAGDVNSISKINKKLLYDCYNTFYNMNNMILSVAGDFNIDEVMEVVDKTIKPGNKIEITRKSIDEPLEVAKNKVEQKLSVSQPQFCVGFKLKPYEGIERIKASVEYQIINEMILGESSDLYREFYETSLVASSDVSTEVFSGREYFAILFEGESKDPDKVFEKIKQEFENLKLKHDINELFNYSKKSIYGRLVKGLSSVDGVVNEMLSAAIDNTNIFKTIDFAANATLEDIITKLNNINVENATLSVINPI